LNYSEDAALVLSVLALCVSAFLAHRQNSIQKIANNVPALVDILSQFRESHLHESFEYIYAHLPSHDPNEGLTGLPAGVRHRVLDVCYFLQQVACLIILNAVREREFLALFRARTMATWNAVEPFVKREREINPQLGPEFLLVLEVFAAKAAAMPPEIGQDILRKWLDRPM
jgi:hypothetical protein